MCKLEPPTVVRSSDIPALVLGFEAKILQELRCEFNVRVVVSDDPSADVKWSALQYLTLDAPAVVVSNEQSDCLAYARSYFSTFSDIYSRRYHYVSESVSETWNAFMLMFHVGYNLIKKNNIGILIFSNIPHEGYDYVFYLVAKYLNLKIVMCYQSLIANRFFINSDIDAFGAFAHSPIIAKFEETNYSLPANWSYMKDRVKDESYSLRAMLGEIFYNPRGVRVAVMRHFYAARYRRNVRASTAERVEGGKYIYFPLHLQPELTTSALGGAYADQLSALEILSGMLPPDYWIYVKENPKQTEMQRGPLFFKRLNALRNVRLLDRKLASIELIKGSEGVALITGTAGWEALFHGKPVMAFGRAWYLGFKGVTQYQDDVTFDSFMNNKPRSVEATVRELDELLTKTGVGVVDFHYAGQVEFFNRHSNARSVCNSIRAYINNLTNRP